VLDPESFTEIEASIVRASLPEPCSRERKRVNPKRKEARLKRLGGWRVEDVSIACRWKGSRNNPEIADA